MRHMHGELRKIRCGNCGDTAAWETDRDQATDCARCRVGGYLRPHVVWFGEMPLYMERIYAALEGCDLFLSIGTSGLVYPAAGFVSEVRRTGRAHTVELNLERSEEHTSELQSLMRNSYAVF